MTDILLYFVVGRPRSE